ncbi:MAG: hypothetical protein FWD13_01520 [Treponema sp.]|nr:hypothetical protein [Treponema sp.]
MRRIKLLIILAAVLLLTALFLTACMPLLVPDDGFIGDPGDIDLEIHLKRLSLNKNELAAIADQNLELILTKTPSFATKNEVIWQIWPPSDNPPDFIEVDQDGKFKTFDVSEPSEAIIRVSSVADPSIYDECLVIVYPNYGSNRYWNFSGSSATVNNGWYAFSRDATGAAQIPFGTINLSADESLGNGMTVRGATGSGSYELPAAAPNGMPLSGGTIPSDANASLYPPYPWVYQIDPDDPYMAGLTPANGVRSGMNWNASNPTVIGFRAGNLITNGAGRVLSIAAIKGPFYIEVRYTSNADGNPPRWADIRIGDKEGVRIQGSPSDHRTLASGRGVASYYYEDDDVVPFVFIESQASIRIYEVIITNTPPAP